MYCQSSVSSKRFKRPDWLERHGFIQDPFQARCTDADTDSILAKSPFVFVEPNNYEQVKGIPEKNPGVPFIFGHSGSGKSSLRRNIKRELDEDLYNPKSNKPKVLAVEYLDHSYDAKETHLPFHSRRISDLILKSVHRLGICINSNIPKNTSGLRLLQEVVSQSCASEKIDYIHLLVDNVDAQQDESILECYNKIRKIACNSNFLGIDKLIVTFFLPADFLRLDKHSLPINRFMPYSEVFDWTSERLREVLNQRLIACTDRTEVNIGIPLLPQLCARESVNKIESALIRFGLEFNQPRAMLSLGYYLLSDHFASSDDGCRAVDELLDFETLERAREKCVKLVESPYAYQTFTKAMNNTISSDTYIKVSECLLNSSVFEDQRTLRSVFGAPSIQGWRNDLPEFYSLSQRVAGVMSYLLDRHDQNGQNGLVLFLQVLCDREPEDLNKQRLLKLVDQVKGELRLVSERSTILEKSVKLKVPEKPQPIILRYLHLSDLHLEGQQRKEATTPSQFYQDSITSSLLEAIEDYKKILGVKYPFDFIIVTGDFAKAGKQEDYQAAHHFVNQLLRITQLSNRNLFIIPGNHDVNRSSIEAAQFKWWYKFENQSDIVDVLTSEDAFAVLMRKFTNFNTFANEAMGRELFSVQKYYYVDALSVKKQRRSFDINFVGLNSALFAGYDGDDQQHLALGEVQVEAALRELDENASLSFAFFHHPFECFHRTDRTNRNRLMQTVDLILHGHLHEPSNTFVRDAAGNAVIIGAGASYESRESENSFNIVEIDLLTGHGEVQFYKYLKDYRRWKRNTDINPNDPDGKFRFQIEKIQQQS